jgi:hypothetical protein
MTLPTVIETTAPPAPLDPDPFIADVPAPGLQAVAIALEPAPAPRRRRIVD